MKKIVIFGGGTGTSIILKELKNINAQITAVISVSDDGKSTGELRKKFNIPAMGDIRKVLSSLSNLPSEYSEFMEYRFTTDDSLNNHAIGNLVLVSLLNQGIDLKTATDYIADLLHVKHKVLPLSNNCLTLMKETPNGKIIEGQASINLSSDECKRIFYKEKPQVLAEVLTSIKEADLIIFSMGSLYTSLLPHLICDEVKENINSSNAKVIYICNALTEPGETDKFTVGKHIEEIYKYLGNDMIDVVVANNKIIDKEDLIKSKNLKKKDLVTIDYDNLEKLKVKLIEESLIEFKDNQIVYNSKKLTEIIEKYIKTTIYKSSIF